MPTELTRSTVYITLHRMTTKKFLTSRLVEDPAGGPARRLYRATGVGYRLYHALRLEYAQ
jgi:DNA-binding PadR family transcriptional regulator